MKPTVIRCWLSDVPSITAPGSGVCTVSTAATRNVRMTECSRVQAGSNLFLPSGGEQAGLFVADMQESSQVAEIAERFFFGLHASIEIVPVMAASARRRGSAIPPPPGMTGANGPAHHGGPQKAHDDGVVGPTRSRRCRPCHVRPMAGGLSLSIRVAP